MDLLQGSAKVASPPYSRLTSLPGQINERVERDVTFSLFGRHPLHSSHSPLPYCLILFSMYAGWRIRPIPVLVCDPRPKEKCSRGKMVPGTCEEIGFNRFQHHAFSMLYTVDKGPKFNFFTCSRNHFSPQIGHLPYRCSRCWYDGFMSSVPRHCWRLSNTCPWKKSARLRKRCCADPCPSSPAHWKMKEIGGASAACSNPSRKRMAIPRRGEVWLDVPGTFSSKSYSQQSLEGIRSMFANQIHMQRHAEPRPHSALEFAHWRAPACARPADLGCTGAHPPGHLPESGLCASVAWPELMPRFGRIRSSCSECLSHLRAS